MTADAPSIREVPPLNRKIGQAERCIRHTCTREIDRTEAGALGEQCRKCVDFTLNEAQLAAVDEFRFKAYPLAPPRCGSW